MFNILSKKKLRIRTEILTKYCNENNISPTAKIHLCQPETELSVVIPAFNEEAYIHDTLICLGKNSIPIEIVVVDNDSTDKTKEIVREASKKIKHPIYILNCIQKGPVHARKRGIDEVVSHYIANKNNYRKKRYIALTDADTQVPENWLKSIIKSYKESDAAALGGIHAYPQWVDEMIEKVLGVKNYYKRLSDLAYYMTKNGFALVQTNGSNFAIEICAYAAIGGSKQPVDDNGNNIKGSDRYFGKRIRDLGEKVAFIPEITITSARSVLFTFSQKKDPGYFRNMKRWVNYRLDEKRLLQNALKHLNKNDWINNQKLRQLSFINHNVIQPAIEGYLDMQPFITLFGKTNDFIKEINKTKKSCENMSLSGVEQTSKYLAEKYNAILVKKIKEEYDLF